MATKKVNNVGQYHSHGKHVTNFFLLMENRTVTQSGFAAEWYVGIGPTKTGVKHCALVRRGPGTADRDSYIFLNKYTSFPSKIIFVKLCDDECSLLFCTYTTERI